MRQGAIESPFLFAWLRDDKVAPLHAEWTANADANPWRVGMLSFADDT